MPAFRKTSVKYPPHWRIQKKYPIFLIKIVAYTAVDQAESEKLYKTEE